MLKDDKVLFFEEMADVIPLKDVNKTQSVSLVSSSLPTAGQLAKQSALNEHELLTVLPLMPYQFSRISPDEIVSHQHDGMQDAVFKQLRLGKYDIKTILDVHEYSLIQARLSLINCICLLYTSPSPRD